MKSLNLKILIVVIGCFISANAWTQACCEKSKKVEGDSQLSIHKVLTSDYDLTDHEGNNVRLNEVIKDKVVVMNFMFTTCKTICPPMGANFVALKKKLGDRVNENMVMLSISIDPSTDTPERLNAWKNKFDDGDDQLWTLLTGKKTTVDQLLKDLDVFTPLIDEHAPIIIMGNASNDNWIRTNGLASPDILAEKVIEYLDEAIEESNNKADLGYFSDLELINQHGEKFRFYSDLLKDKIVFINPFFADCPGSCPIMHTMMKDVQKHLGDKLGSSVLLLSITVDPINDTPDKLKDYAASYDAKPGWHFLSGSVGNVNAVMKKLGKYVESREQHDTILLIGNMNTKLWKKANGLASSAEIIKVLDSVVYDTGESD
ncbi:MAG: SCO family protein [Saprospiraceae bacterium]|nr:SCO family protein [Saprospiraceae bacterium]